MAILNETFVAFDLETTGKYPLQAEICEIAGVKWKQGRVIDEFQSYLKIAKPMDPRAFQVHGITKEVLAEAPEAAGVIAKFYEFLQGAVPIAHHAAFDMGFVAVEFERLGFLPEGRAAVCTSRLAKAVVTETPNHRLATLAGYFALPAYKAHSALDDAKTCLGVALKCFERLTGGASIDSAYKAQKTPLHWSMFYLSELKSEPRFQVLLEAISQQKEVSIVYDGGSAKGKARSIYPEGLVRTPDGDFVVATAPGDTHAKRFYLNKIRDARFPSEQTEFKF